VELQHGCTCASSASSSCSNDVPFVVDNNERPTESDFDFQVCYNGQWQQGRLFLMRWLADNANLLTPTFAHFSDKVISSCFLGGKPPCDKGPARCEQQCRHFSAKICDACAEEAGQLGFPICAALSCPDAVEEELVVIKRQANAERVEFAKKAKKVDAGKVGGQRGGGIN